MAEIILVGVAVLDLTLYPVPEDFLLRQKQPLEKILFSPGGDALNQAVTLRKFGRSCALCACLGEDDAARMVEKKLSDFGVEQTILVHKKEFPTTCAAVLVEKNGERHIGTVRGAHTKLSASDLPFSALSGAKALSVGSFFSCDQMEEDGGLLALLKAAKEKGVTTFSDTGPDKQRKGLAHLSQFLPYVDYFLPSIYDAQELTGKEDPFEAAQVLLSCGVKNAVIKCDKDGCLFQNREERFRVPTCEVNPVDTTGAGDCFVGAFIHKTLSGAAITDALRFSCAAATLHTQFTGACTSPLAEESVRQYAQEHGI